eukprot:SAG25_NODE_6602_length_546_cov_0.917226_1_plen_181_part_11
MEVWLSTQLQKVQGALQEGDLDSAERELALAEAAKEEAAPTSAELAEAQALEAAFAKHSRMPLHTTSSEDCVEAANNTEPRGSVELNRLLAGYRSPARADEDSTPPSTGTNQMKTAPPSPEHALVQLLAGYRSPPSVVLSPERHSRPLGEALAVAYSSQMPLSAARRPPPATAPKLAHGWH